VLVSGAPGGDRRLPPVPGVDIDLFGVNRSELVGGHLVSLERSLTKRSSCFP